jgi:MFS family permease
MSVGEVANFMAAMMAGGMVVQWPLGRISDLVDRRWVMGVACILAAGAAAMASRHDSASWELYLLAFLFGGFTLSLYSLVVALTNDHLRPAEIIPASGTIVMVSGLASVSGPLTAATLMQNLGMDSFFLMLAVALLLMAAISIWRVLTIPALPPEYKTHSTLQAPQAPVGTILHAEDEEPE